MTSHCSAIQDPRFEREKTGKEIILQEPISPLGSKLLNSLNKWK